MAARGLEARLTSRLAPVIALSLAAVSAVAIVTTSRALAAAETSRARDLGITVLRSFAEELGEQEAPGGDIASAAHEVHAEVDGDEVHVEVEPSPADVARLGPYVPGATHPEEASFGVFGALDPGACTLVDHGGSHYRACATAISGRRAVVAVRVDKDRIVLRDLALGMLVTFVLAVFAALYAARRALHEPLDDVRRLAEWSERIAARGAGADGTEEPPPAARGRTQEIAQLTSSFGALVGALVETLGRERASSAHIAHEMRTPLTALRADLEALGPEAATVASRLRADVDRLAQVIDAVLVLSSPRKAVRGETINVADLARALARTHAPADAVVDAPEEALVDADDALVRLALVNLLENAARHAAPGARRVRITREGDAVRLSVIDAGPGLDADARARAFERYWRAASPDERRGGSGLGLALVRAVAEQHDGAADVRSSAFGPGADVGFTLRPVLAWHDGAASPV